MIFGAMLTIHLIIDVAGILAVGYVIIASIALHTAQR
jgi:hypothetical protein